MNDATRDYVLRHRNDDVRQLALHPSRDSSVDMHVALEQIAAYQTARHKLPSWAGRQNIIYGPRLAMEQCSSELTARYKAELVCRLIYLPTAPLLIAPNDQTTNPPNDQTTNPPNDQTTNPPNDQTTLIDLTGGMGVDFSFMAPHFSRAIYVEQQEQLCAIAAHNFAELGLQQVTVCCNDGTELIRRYEGHADVVYLDPARRDDHGQRTYAIANCRPDLLELREVLTAKARWVVAKLSPMLDWRKAIADLGRQYVRELHIVAADNECKELIVVMATPATGNGAQSEATGGQEDAGCRVVCVNLAEEPADSQTMGFCFVSTTAGAGPLYGGSADELLSMYLYEPNAALMKGGFYGDIARLTDTQQLSTDSHLYVSATPRPLFPGRRFRIVATAPATKSGIKALLGNDRRASITVRNFPLTVAELRRKLKVSEGGQHYLFATTLARDQHLLILCDRTSET